MSKNKNSNDDYNNHKMTYSHSWTQKWPEYREHWESKLSNKDMDNIFAALIEEVIVKSDLSEAKKMLEKIGIKC